VGTTPFDLPGYWCGEAGLGVDGQEWMPMPELLFDRNWGAQVGIPDWLLLLGIAASATLPWLHWCFSLRTLLIATTLLAVVLGLAVYVTRQ